MKDLRDSDGDVTAAWLTAELQRFGYLVAGEVTTVTQRVSRIGETVTSHFDELEIGYSHDVAGQVPRHCLLKRLKPHLFATAAREAVFYDLMAQTPHSPALLRCYGTHIDAAAQSTMILLEDKGDDGFLHTEWPLPPDVATCERMLRSLADVHARWWQSPRLDSEGLTRTNDATVDGVIDLFENGFAGFCDRLGDNLSQARRTLLEKIVDRVTLRWRERIQTTDNQTLVHGDAHCWNFLVPEEPEAAPVIIDWQDWEVGHGATDLAYMIGLHWFPERRQRYEQQLLAIYLRELEQHDINYSMHDLWFDYRLRVALQPIIPVIQQHYQIPAVIWWPHLDRAFAAFSDLGCEEFLA